MKQFENALVGLRKIYIAEIFDVISVILLVTGTVLAVLSVDQEDPVALGIAMLVCLVVGVVLSIISFFQALGGTKRAALDEPKFKDAYWCIVLPVAMEIGKLIVAIAFPNTDYLTHATGVLPEICEIFFVVYVISGIQKLFDKKGDVPDSKKGDKVQIIVCLPMFISAVLSVVSIFIKVSATIETIVLFGSAIFSVVGYFMFLSYINKARNVLAE